MSETKYDVWVFGDNSHKWERYTAVLFGSKAIAEKWVREYIPNATSEIRAAPTRERPTE